MFKKLLLVSILTLFADFGFSQLTVQNTTAMAVTVQVTSWNGSDCGTSYFEGTFVIPALTTAPISLDIAGNVGMRIRLVDGSDFWVETEPGTPPGCTYVYDVPDHIDWDSSVWVRIQ